MQMSTIKNFTISSFPIYSSEPISPFPPLSENSPEGRILIVEDNPDHREILKTRLTSLGYVCQETDDGHEGLCALSYSRFDLVMCDYQMPEMNGLQFIHTVRTTSGISIIPIIFMTAHSDPFFIDHAVSVGATATLVKPFSLENLKTALDRIWTMKRNS